MDLPSTKVETRREVSYRSDQGIGLRVYGFVRVAKYSRFDEPLPAPVHEQLSVAFHRGFEAKDVEVRHVDVGRFRLERFDDAFG